MIDSKHVGSSLDDFLAEEGVLEEASAAAEKRVREWLQNQEQTSRAVQPADRVAFDGAVAIATAPAD